MHDFNDLLEFIFLTKIIIPSEYANMIKSPMGIKILQSFLRIFKQENSIQAISQQVQNETQCKAKEFWNIIRIALTGQIHGPSLDAIINIYGHDKVELHIQNAINHT